MMIRPQGTDERRTAGRERLRSGHRRAHAGQLPLQGTQRRTVGEAKRRIQLLRGRELLARSGEITDPRVELGGDEMCLGVLRMITQHLVDHLLRLGEVPGLCRLIDLMRGGIGLSERRTGDTQNEDREQ